MKTQRAKSLITFHFARESSNDMMSYQRNSNNRTVTGFASSCPLSEPAVSRWPVVSPTSPFAHVPFANVLCRSAKKRNERCACIRFVLSTMTQKSAIRMCIPRSFSYWSSESSEGTDPTLTRNDFKSLRTGRWWNDRKPVFFCTNWPVS